MGRGVGGLHQNLGQEDARAERFRTPVPAVSPSLVWMYKDVSPLPGRGWVEPGCKLELIS